jgi:hypothetical protein
MSFLSFKVSIDSSTKGQGEIYGTLLFSWDLCTTIGNCVVGHLRIYGSGQDSPGTYDALVAVMLK